MRALARVGVFVEMAAVELREAVGVTREMRGSPIENDADAGPVAAIDELHEFRRGAVTAGGGEVAQSLVSPGAVIRMFHHRKQFDVRIAEFFNVRNELIAKLAISEPAIVILGDPAP